MAFHWLSWDSLSVAGLLLEVEENLPPAGSKLGAKAAVAPSCKVLLFWLGLQLNTHGRGVRAPPAGPPIPYPRVFPLLIFTVVCALQSWRAWHNTKSGAEKWAIAEMVCHPMGDGTCREIFLSSWVSASNKEQLEREMRNRNYIYHYYTIWLTDVFCLLWVPFPRGNVSSLRAGIMSVLSTAGSSAPWRVPGTKWVLSNYLYSEWTNEWVRVLSCRVAFSLASLAVPQSQTRLSEHQRQGVRG